MVYSDFTIDRVRNELGVTLDFSQSLFHQVVALSASDWLVQTLDLMAPLATANTEKARSDLWSGDQWDGLAVLSSGRHGGGDRSNRVLRLAGG
jgi:hypothetical protein